MSHPGSPFWVPSGALQRHVNRTTSGSPENDWLTFVRAKNLPASLSRVLILGCGDGFIERALVRKSGVGSIIAADTDRAMVERGRRRAARLGWTRVSYEAFDPEAFGLPPGPFDAIIVHDLLHHVARPERVLALIHDALAPSGRLVFVEYAGPDRFQYSDERMELVRRYFRLLPERLRRDPASGRILWKRERVDAAKLARDDPFEAARSEELLPLARRLFATEAEYSAGGGLLHPLLSGLALNFGRNRAEDEPVLQVLCAAEAHLEQTGLLPADFAVFVGRRRRLGSPMT